MATKSVSSFAELKLAVEDADTTEIVVTNDIVFGSGGAKVNLTKSNLVIDFGGHTITDSNTLTFTNAIYIASTTNTITVIAKNAKWLGRNYYGVVGVYDGNTNSSIVLENIDYIGPQFVYNKNGKTTITNCTITLEKNGSSAGPQEFCEANRLTISGNVVVNSLATSTAVVWFTGANASLTVEENSTFEVIAPSTYLLYTDVAPDLLFKKNSSTKISTKGGLFYNSSSSSHIAKTFSLLEDASFIAYKTASSSVPMFKCQSAFSIAENATFQLFSEVSSTSALVYFSQVANISILSPKSVVLYNNGGNVFSFQTGSASSPNILTVATNLFCLWDSAKTPLSSAGDFDDVPTTQYHKKDYASNVEMKINLSSSQVLSVENNLTDQDVGYPLTTSINLLKSKVISMGNLTLSVDEITDLSQAVTGTTDALANVKVENGSAQFLGTANDDGSFSVALTNTPTVDSVVKTSVNKQFLTKSLNSIVVGTISISKISTLNYLTFVSPSASNIIFRQNADWSIEVTDTRTSGGEWYLYAHIVEPLSFENEKLENALVFKYNGQKTILSSSPLLVYTGKWQQSQTVTTISWSEIEGFLLEIVPNFEYKAGKYSTNLFWQISTTKMD